MTKTCGNCGYYLCRGQSYDNVAACNAYQPLQLRDGQS
jgi:hypothetical protein